MVKYKSIAVIYGSDTSESEVSCRSGEYTASQLDESLYDVYEIYARFGKWNLVAYRKKDSMRVLIPKEAQPQIDKNDFSVSLLGEKIKFDYAYIMQHGSPGENGLLQAYFEIISVPYSGCSAFVSSLVFDKYSCKSYLRQANLVKLAKDILINIDDEDIDTESIISELSLPLFVKPTNAGSSFGISKVLKKEDLLSSINLAFIEGKSLILESALEGRELTCAAYYDGNRVRTLPLIEIVSKNSYFDYDAKYNGNSQELCPAPIPKEMEEEVRICTERIYKYFHCGGLVRMDYIYTNDGLYFLEINTIPGMTNASLVPKMIREAGMDMRDFLNTIISNT